MAAPVADTAARRTLEPGGDGSAAMDTAGDASAADALLSLAGFA